jgi:hypothetical protein
MFNNHQREKLVNAINYFVRETKHCHTLKLFKLLNFLDFEHFRETGLSVTGLTYKAWQQGPAPSELWHELRRGAAPDLAKSVSIVPVTDDLTNEIMRRDLKAAAAFDESYFSKREIKIMKMLAEIFLETDGKDMSSFSHSRNLPWHKIYANGTGKGREIPYELSRSSDPVLPLIETLPEADYKYRKAVFLP